MSPPRLHLAPAISLVAMLLLSTGGCVHRRLTIRSNPPAAKVYVDGRDAGLTPATVDFTYYATREIRLVKPGYETMTKLVPVRTPWYQVPPFDFFSDNLLPTQVTNRNEFTFQLVPQVVVPQSELIERANTLRTEARIESAPRPSP